jgi:hypothetical protein
MPGFEAIKFTMADTTMAGAEKTTVEYGSTDYIQIKTTVKDGPVTIPILYINTNGGNVSGIGQSITQKLVTSKDSSLWYNATSGSTQSEGFVASWASTKDAESYYLRATTRYDSDGVRNLTTIKNKITGDTLCEDLKVADTCTIGNVILTVNSIGGQSAGDKFANFSINSGGSFYSLYTTNGVKIVLPYDTYNTVAAPGAINLSASNNSAFTLQLFEKDKDGTLASGGAVNLSLTSSGSGSNYKSTISSTIT